MRPNLREHQANERTFLAWLRTGIAIIAFGFVLERFSLFLRYLGAGTGLTRPGHADIVGVSLICLGTILIPVALWRFLLEERRIDRPIETGPGHWPMIGLAILLMAVGIYLAIVIMP